MSGIQDKLNSLYGSEIKSIYFDFRNNEINIDILVYERDVPEEFQLKFGEVSKYELEKDWAKDKWEVIGIAEIFYLPEIGRKVSIDNEKKSKFNFMIDGDGFVLFIYASILSINEEDFLIK